jgi:hypothetical protein
MIGEKEDAQTFEERATVGGRALVEGVVEGVCGGEGGATAS